MSHPLLDGLAGLTGPLLRDRLIAARAAAIAAAAGDKSSPVYLAMVAQQDRVVAVMREAVEAIVASLPEAPATPEPEAAAPAAQAPIRRAPPPPLKSPPAKASPAASRLAGLKRAPVEDAEPPEPAEAAKKPYVWTPPPPVTPQCRPVARAGAPAKRPPPPPLDLGDRDIPW